MKAFETTTHLRKVHLTKKYKCFEISVRLFDNAFILKSDPVNESMVTPKF